MIYLILKYIIYLIQIHLIEWNKWWYIYDFFNIYIFIFNYHINDIKKLVNKIIITIFILLSIN